MTRLVFDVETDGLLRDLTTIHCLVTHDLDTGHTERYDNEKNNNIINAKFLNLILKINL